MSFFIMQRIENVPIDCVELDNDDFKISKPCADEKLKDSIHVSGLLDPPVLLKNNGTYIIIYGHNRLRILKELHINSAASYIIDVLDPKTYIDFAILKNYRNGISATGKIKFIRILKNKLNLNNDDIAVIAKKMQFPGELLHDKLYERLPQLPEALRDYIDLKDIGFKVIKNILRLPEEAFSLLSRWVMHINIRVNIFKGIVDLILDIYKRDKTISGLIQIDLSSCEDRRGKEEYIYKEIFEIRYPEYTAIKSTADNIINIFKKTGVEVDFPEYLEKDEIWIKLKLNKRDGIEFFKKTINQIDTDALKKLLDLI